MLGLVLLLALIASSTSSEQQLKNRLKQLDPEKVKLFAERDYLRKKDIYVARGEKEEALATCLELVEVASEADSDRCQLQVYDEFDDIDNKIRLYEKMLERKLANGDSGVGAKSVLEGLREKRDKQRK